MLTEEGVVLRNLNGEAFGVEDKLADRGGAIVFTTFYSVASITGQSTNNKNINEMGTLSYRGATY